MPSPRPPSDVEDQLREIRTKIDSVDHRLVKLIAERVRCVSEVAALKASSTRKLRDVEREETLLTDLVALGEQSGIDSYLLTRVFQEIIDHSLRLQLHALSSGAERSTFRVGYQGTEGSYSHAAAVQHFAAVHTSSNQTRHLELMGFAATQDVVEAVSNGRVTHGVLPLENTIAGSINETYQYLTDHALSIVGEEVLRILYCLVGNADHVPLEKVRRIVSHPQPLALCANFLRKLQSAQTSRKRSLSIESYPDTAMAAQKVAHDADPSQMAIASLEAARRYDLKVVKNNVSDHPEHYTRYAIVSQDAVAYDTRVPCKTSIIFGTGHEEGALLKCLNIFAEHGLRFTKLESRPRPHTQWEYLFYADFEGNLGDGNVKQALDTLRLQASFLKTLGSYPSRTSRALKAAQPKKSRQISR